MLAVRRGSVLSVALGRVSVRSDELPQPWKPTALELGVVDSFSSLDAFCCSGLVARS